jgi:p-aminobenzoyl-glutamate transporter AbgT
MYKQGSMERLGIQPVPLYPVDDGCLNRIPYSSVIAFVMCFVGVVMFAIMMVFSFNASVEQARRALEISNIPWLDKVSASLSMFCNNYSRCTSCF